MKLEKAVTCIWSCMLSFLLSFAGIACLATAFEMAVDMKVMVLWCAGASVVCSACYVLPLGLIPLGGLALAGGFMWRTGSLIPSIEALLYRISRQYNLAYSWGIVRWSHNTADDMELILTTALCLLGVVIALVVARGVCRRKSAFPGMLLGVLPLAACLVVTDTVPQMTWLFLFLLAAVMLILTSSVRRQDEEQANRLSGVVILPVALALLILFAAAPQETYTGQADARHMVDLVVNTEPLRSILMHFSDTGTSGSSVDGRSVNLKTVGVRMASKAEILRVNADYEGKLYLRGRGLDAYDGVSWAESNKSTGVLSWPTAKLETAGEVVITTRYAHRMLYLPYYVRSRDMEYVNVGIENEKKLSQYSFTCTVMPDQSVFAKMFPTQNSRLETEWSDQMLGQFIQLDDSVRKWAVPLAREITQGIESPYHKAQAIAEYVRNSATYSTNTYRMPSNKKDFARWFLEDSDTGYCVHFATAATVLLQAAGIPARYITGYTVNVKPARMTVVRAEDAHAWAEYWLPGFGWTVLEATPAAQETPEATTQPATEEETAPNTTAADRQTEPSSPAATRPASKPTHSQKKVEFPVWILWTLGGVLLFVGVMEGQRKLRLQHRRRRYEKATVNQQAVLLWLEITKLTGYLDVIPPEKLLTLALKARFSQHTVSDEELGSLEEYLALTCARLKKEPLHRRIGYRYFFVAY